MARRNTNNNVQATETSNAAITTFAAYAAMLTEAAQVEGHVLPNGRAAYATASSGEGSTENLQAFTQAVQQAINVLQANGKPIGASTVYNMLDGRTCYKQALRKAATGLGSSKHLAAFLEYMGFTRNDRLRRAVSKAGTEYTAQHGKFALQS